jgi:hypothetical protein
MITFLKVPYSEKDEAKKLGARWNPEKKSWYVENVNNLLLFKKWLPEVKNFNKQVEEIVSDDTKKTFAEWQKIFEEENSKKKKSNKLTKSQKKAKKEAIQQKANETRQRNLLALQEKKNKKPIDFVGGETYTTVGEFYIQSFDDSIPW